MRHKQPDPSGYSGTPLPKKLGIAQGSCLLLLDAPHEYLRLLAPLPPDVHFARQPDRAVDIAQVFVTRKEDLGQHLAILRKQLSPDAVVWVSWPKKAARMPTNITEDTVRELALPLGFVDIKVCAVSEVWSGLKLVVRKALR